MEHAMAPTAVQSFFSHRYTHPIESVTLRERSRLSTFTLHQASIRTQYTPGPWKGQPAKVIRSRVGAPLPSSSSPGGGREEDGAGRDNKREHSCWLAAEPSRDHKDGSDVETPPESCTQEC